MNRLLISMFVPLVVSWEEWGDVRKIQILFPPNWGLITELPLLLRADASAFSDVWLNQGLTLALIFGSDLVEIDSWNATFRIEEPM